MWNNRSHEYLRISGSYAASGNWAALVTIHWQQELYKLGYTNIIVVSEDFAFNSKVDLKSFPHFKNILPESVQDFLANVPEARCGTHLVDIHLRDRTIIHNMCIFNCSEFYYCEEIETDNVKYVRESSV